MTALQMRTRRPYFGFFGDGSDGVLSISAGTTSLTRDMYYRSVNVEGTGIIQPNGFKIFVLGPVTLKSESGDPIVIDARGGSGTNAVIATGGAAGTAKGGGTLCQADSGQKGLNGGLGAGASDFTIYVSQPGIGGSGGSGGDGGDSSTDFGGNGSSGRAIILQYATARNSITDHLLYGNALPYAGGTGGLGGAGAGDTVFNGGGSGGSGAGGGAVWIRCLSFNNEGRIAAEGGNGGNGGNAEGGDAGGGGGSGGGGGGFIVVCTKELINAGTMTVNGGSGGLGGVALGASSGANGKGGADGSAGRSIIERIFI